MRAFDYVRASDVDQAVALVTADPAAAYLAGGTAQVNLMKDGVLTPEKLIDITRLPLGGISRTDAALHVGALTTMEELAADGTVRDRLPVVREAAAGRLHPVEKYGNHRRNLLQRTRCRYSRDPGVAACHKRKPSSGARSGYLKVSDRAAYEFALSSAGVALVIEDGVLRDARVGLGGVGSTPWRARHAEEVLRGAPATGETFRSAAAVALHGLHGAWTVPGTAFKVTLAQRTLMRSLRTVSGVRS